ncbi:MAG: hypothetical protein HYW01_10525 [Deltaproteobacteria bacterium]|nr:hypothetical protein [Deltaproteobacteria bacterium]
MFKTFFLILIGIYTVLYLEISSFIGSNNIFDEKYNSPVRVNAAGGRFFEPAPGVKAYGSFSLAYVF